MIQFLRDSIWQFILGIIGIGVAVIIYFMQRRNKSLSYQVLAETPLLTVNEELKGKLQITFEGTPVQDVRLVLLKIANDGKVPVISSDFEKPISFSFGERSRILSAQVIDTTPKSLKPMLNPESNQIVLQPTLLNSGDALTIKLLFAQYDGIIEPDARIIGVREIRRVADGRGKESLIIVTVASSCPKSVVSGQRLSE